MAQRYIDEKDFNKLQVLNEKTQIGQARFFFFNQIRLCNSPNVKNARIFKKNLKIG